MRHSRPPLRPPTPTDSSGSIAPPNILDEGTPFGPQDCLAGGRESRRELASVPTALSGYPPERLIGACLAPSMVWLARAVKVVHPAPYACAVRLHLDRALFARTWAPRKARWESASPD